ncbi:hypothetical protein CYMTET_28545, partial [Cymbomonas tetramitiformis]
MSQPKFGSALKGLMAARNSSNIPNTTNLHSSINVSFGKLMSPPLGSTLSESSSPVEGRHSSRSPDSGFVNKHRKAVYNARSVSDFSLSSSERRLPGDGGPSAEKASKDVNAIASACEDVPIFQRLHREDRRALYESMYELDYEPGESIICQGEEGRNFYIIVDGMPTVQVKGAKGDVEVVKQLFPGDTFGEVSLLHSCPRSASVFVPLEDQRVKVWALDRKTFKELLSKFAFERRKRLEGELSKVTLLSGLSDYKRIQLAEALVSQTFDAGSFILTQGDPEGARFHIIIEGAAQVIVNGEVVNSLKVGSYFGEINLLSDDAVPTASVVALEPVSTLTLDRSSFRRLLDGKAVKAIMHTHMQQYVFKDDLDSPAGIRKLPSIEDDVTSPLVFRTYPSLPRTPSPTTRKEAVLENLKRKDFLFLKELGVGMSGNAYLCRMPNHGNKYVVIKLMRKSKLLRINQIRGIPTEQLLPATKPDWSFCVLSVLQTCSPPSLREKPRTI